MKALDALREQGAIFVYSMINVREARAFHDPKQYVEVIEEIGGLYMPPRVETDDVWELKSGMAKELLLAQHSFADDCIDFFEHSSVLLQYSMSWLGDADLRELEKELEQEIVCLAQRFENEAGVSAGSGYLYKSLLETLHAYTPSINEPESPLGHIGEGDVLNSWYGEIDQRAPENVVEFILKKLGGKLGKAC